MTSYSSIIGNKNRDWTGWPSNYKYQIIDVSNYNLVSFEVFYELLD